MPPKRNAIRQSTNQAKRRREERASETSEQRQARRERNRVHTALSRSLETSEQREVDDAVLKVTDAAIPKTSNSHRKLCAPWWNSACFQAKGELGVFSEVTKNRSERTPINFRCRQFLPYNCDFYMWELKRAVSSAHNTCPGPDGISHEMLRH
ncbi:hypothetical protein TNCV_3422431 [Trichonephila clavipes]|nr:hypothetical protein TNCV_3422431 [Trichonephila clavipes]